MQFVVFALQFGCLSLKFTNLNVNYPGACRKGDTATRTAPITIFIFILNATTNSKLAYSYD